MYIIWLNWWESSTVLVYCIHISINEPSEPESGNQNIIDRYWELAVIRQDRPLWNYGVGATQGHK